jgi:hypothetical protein
MLWSELGRFDEQCNLAFGPSVVYHLRDTVVGVERDGSFGHPVPVEKGWFLIDGVVSRTHRVGVWEHSVA